MEFLINMDQPFSYKSKAFANNTYAVSYTHLDVYKRQTVGYQYDGLTEEDRFVQKVLQEHYDKVYKENLSHSDPMTYIAVSYTHLLNNN